MQLNTHVDELNTVGVNVVAISYDDHTQNHSFSSAEQLKFLLLSDQGAQTVETLGILNEEYEKGHAAYGIPHPGVLFVNADKSIAFKRAVQSYKERPKFEELVATVKQHVNDS